jgi:NAD-dependent oxidoreductase involved in siderophore biosynthesis
MKISESIEAHLCSAVAAISQRNQATLTKQVIEHPICLTVFHRLYRLAKASGFCLSFCTNFKQRPAWRSE